MMAVWQEKMGHIVFLFGVLALMASGVSSAPSEEQKGSPVQQCSGQNFECLSDRVKISPCGKTRCKLRKGTNATIAIHFKPDHEVKELITDVSGILNGVPLPFLGVSGSSACDRIVLAETSEPAPCPLQPDVEYIYSKTFSIEPFYPSVSVKVHWALYDGKKDIICFEAPVVIK